jgi:hypothetical protein
VFSAWSVPRCYKQDRLGVELSELVGKLVSELEDCWDSAIVSYCC